MRKVDTTIALRRERGKIVLREFEWSTADAIGAPARFALELAQPLPDRCARHGRPAVRHIDTEMRMHTGFNGSPVETSWWSSFLESWLTHDPSWGPSTVGEVSGRRPMCARCMRQRAILHGIAYCLGLAGPLALVVLFLAAQAGVLQSVSMPLILAFFPGWLPGGLAVALTLYARGNRPVRARPLTSASAMTIRAHPAFAEALAARCR
ncbi:hypothetical protein [Nocardia flavorosea]|uniref:hypothetical protein n=1 Tax=Nocardia flavorosea TaxID=53429 RepID=UPI002454CFC7|nr:hypothetical protein [Nocardia flavorosea]